MSYRPQHYYRHDEMTELLRELTTAHPRYAALRSIGTSPQGRDLWVVTITDTDAGAAEDKPAYWIDANTHASEVAGNAAALYTIDYVLKHLDEPEIAQLLRQRTLYIAPRVNPDGAEFCLAEQHYVRSVRRPFPDPEPTPGLVPSDVDGDGFVLQMRIEAPDGAWRVSTKDERLLIARKPWDTVGPFYHLYREGTFDESALRDPRLPMMETDPHGLDFNRNYPWKWRPHPEQWGAGSYPLSEPETRAVVDFMLAHRNICGVLTYHTFTGVLLRPFSDRADDGMPAFDRHTFEAIGARCEELTGYPCISVFHDFAYDPTKAIGGVFDDWCYEQYGVHAYTMELWDPQVRAKVPAKDKLLDHWFKPTEDDQLCYLRWNDEDLDGEGFVDWRPFQHPQLGDIEIGGWKFMTTFRNPPAKYLEEVCHGSCLFTLDHARSGPLPRLELRVEPLDADLKRVVATMRNDGYLPTYVTQQAKDAAIVRQLHLEVSVTAGLEVVDGPEHQRVEHLDGYANQSNPPFASNSHYGKTRRNVLEREWLVRGSGVFSAVWRGDRIGRVSALVEV